LLKLAYQERIIDRKELGKIPKELKQTEFRISSELEEWLLK